VNGPSAPLLTADIEVLRRAMTINACLSVGSGERLALFGTSGAGKTTIIEAIAGFVKLERGSVRIDGVLVAAPRHGGPLLAPRQRRIALVRQPTSLFPHLTVEQNIGYGARGAAAPPPDLIGRLGLEALRGARPLALSGGQRQRVALGRALASPFRVLLLDEPLSAVDAVARAGLRQLAIEVAAARGAAAIIVTHDLPEAQAYGTALGIIEGGRILQLDRADHVVAHPATRRVAELVGYAGFVPATGGRSEAGGGPLFAVHPDRVVTGAYPQRGLVLSGVVTSVRPYGPRVECLLALAGGATLAARLDGSPPTGSRLTVTAVDPPLVPPAVAGDAAVVPSAGATVRG
jgi:ABC-type Fe3+/spermidine/putrescine transport system ATPase subunit